MSRVVVAQYQDPLDRIWTACAERVGLRIVRSGEAYASTDGAGTLVLGTPDTLDGDDCLAQMIFHELCHAMIQGVDSLTLRDWGLDNRSNRDEPRERACLRLQAVVAGQYGLRGFLAPTTDHRAFFDRLGADPLEDAPAEERRWADDALRCLDRSPFGPHVRDALAATASIVRIAEPFRIRSVHSLYDDLPPPRQ